MRVHPCRLQPAAAEYDGGLSECPHPLRKGNNKTNPDVVEETAPLDRKITDMAALAPVLADEVYSSGYDDEPSSCITTMTPPTTQGQRHAASDPYAQAIDSPVIPIVTHPEEHEESVDHDGPADQNSQHDYIEKMGPLKKIRHQRTLRVHWLVFKTSINEVILKLYQLGLYSLRRRPLISIGIPIINLRRSSDRLRFIMGIPIPVKRCLLSE